MSDTKEILESQIREIYGRVIYTHKTHEKCSDILTSRRKTLRVVEILLSAATTTSVLIVVFGEGQCFKFLSALLSTALLALTLYSKDFDLSAIAEKHKQAALEILAIRESLLSLLVDIKVGNKPVEALQSKRDNINLRLVNIYKGAPDTTAKAYHKASKALKENEEFTFSNEEIDKFLPESLRRT